MSWKPNLKACCNLSKIQTYVRENKRLRQGKELARFCLEAEFEYIRRMMLQGAAVYRYIAGLEAEHGKFHPVRPVDTLPYWRYRETKNLAACGAEEGTAQEGPVRAERGRTGPPPAVLPLVY